MEPERDHMWTPIWDTNIMLHKLRVWVVLDYTRIPRGQRFSRSSVSYYSNVNPVYSKVCLATSICIVSVEWRNWCKCMVVQIIYFTTFKFYFLFFFYLALTYYFSIYSECFLFFYAQWMSFCTFQMNTFFCDYSKVLPVVLLFSSASVVFF